MRGRLMSLLLLIGVIGLLACAEREPAPAERAPAAASSDHVCTEHGVLEAVCTKCNPKLAPVFQAKGDWCEEHGFPESFCPICHPDRGGRPATDVGTDDEPPADRLKVRLASPETFQIAGIETEKGRRVEGADGFVVPARLAYDAGRRAEINARSAGVVREVLVDVGSRVRVGAPLVVLDSPEVGADRSRLGAARSKVDVAKAQLERERALFAEGIAPQREVQIAESELAAAEAEVLALEAAGGVVGLGGVSGRYTLHAPLAGVVVRRAATIGRQVDTDEVLLEIVDASILWAEIDVPEPRLDEIAIGSAVTLTFDAVAGRSFHGSIASIAPEVDPHTRTAMARVKLQNDDGVLRANMYGRARIQTGGASGGVEVPRTAVQRANGADVVFVRLTDTLYETRRVETGTRTDGWVEITRGVAAGEDVVTVGSFLLKTETLKGSIGAGCCEAN
jgi:cobalt-zinc-cadmium efflux system membrane fusion protein